MQHRSALVHFIIAGAVAAGCLVAAAPASALWFLPEVRLGSETSLQAGCDVSGTKVVYHDGRSGTFDIYLYDLTKATETRLTTNTGNQTFPVISGDWVAYQDDRNGSGTDHDIYVYNLRTKTERRITSIAGDQANPAISGNRVAWQDDRSGNDEIYVKDLKTDVTTRLTRQAADQENPAISGTRVVWEDDRNGNLDIYLRDLASGRVSRLTTSTRDDSSPAISGTRVAYVADDFTGGAPKYEIVVYDLAATTANVVDEGTAPDIEGTKLVYVTATYSAGSLLDPHLDITLHDLTLGLEQQATVTGVDASTPAIAGSHIVYQRGTLVLFPLPPKGHSRICITRLATPKLTARVDATSVPYGTQVSLIGRLTTAGDSFIDGKTIALQYSTDHTAWKDGATAATVRGGNVVIPSPALLTSRYLRLRWPGDQGFLGTISMPILVKPSVYLTVPSAPASVKRDAAFSTTGFLKPWHRAGSYPVKVQCYRGVKQADSSIRWVAWKTVRAEAINYATYTKYRASLSLPYAGQWRICAWHPADEKNASTRTAWREFTVR